MTEPREPDDALRPILQQLVSASHRLTRLAASTTGSTESTAVWRTLSDLGTIGPVRLGELARYGRVSQPTMTKIVTNLVDRGWLKRLPDPDDARAFTVTTTPAGEAALEGWRRELSAAMLPLFADLTDGDVDTLRGTVDIVTRQLQKGIA